MDPIREKTIHAPSAFAGFVFHVGALWVTCLTTIILTLCMCLVCYDVSRAMFGRDAIVQAIDATWVVYDSWSAVLDTVLVSVVLFFVGCKLYAKHVIKGLIQRP